MDLCKTDKLEKFKEEHKWLGYAHKRQRLTILKSKLRKFRKKYEVWKDIGMPGWLRQMIVELSKYKHWRSEAKRLRWEMKRIKNPEQVEGISEEKIREANRVPLERFVEIKKQGSPAKAKCPLHDDSDPSFAIYDNNTYYCFGCKKSGDMIKFIEETRGLDFKEAVKFLTE